ncbi:MAG TPA: hypothetical protein VF996_02415 [Candidatus Saccharimonadales bacterium]
MQRVRFLLNSVNWGSVAHASLSISVPLIVLLLIRLDLVPLAVATIIASKWRVIAVQPRHWLANFRTNSPDLIVNFSFLVLLVKAETVSANILLVGLYVLWLIWLKPKSTEIWVGVQALATHMLGLTALFWLADDIPESLVVIVAWLIGLSASRHFISHFEETLIRVISFGWAFFVAQIAWLSNRWLIIYPISSDVVIPQAAIVITLIAYILGSLYYLNHKGTLKRSIMRQYTVVGCAILLMIIMLTDWSGAR